MALPGYPDPEDLEIEPVVILLVPQPATLAAIVMATVARSSLFPVAFVKRLVNICAGSPISSAWPPEGSTPIKSNIPLTLTDG
jgi:hypothetical protein